MITISLELLKERMGFSADYDWDVLYVARERSGIQTHIVFDIFNIGYEPNMAHIKGKNDLPVISIFFTRGEEVTVGEVVMPVVNSVNKQIQDIHDLEGIGSQPPFSIDRADGKIPTYPRPWVTGRWYHWVISIHSLIISHYMPPTYSVAT
jgi:hypothetical protein